VVATKLTKKVRWCEMLEKILLQLLFLSLYTNIFFAILIIILFIVIAINTYKKNHISRKAD